MEHKVEIARSGAIPQKVFPMFINIWEGHQHRSVFDTHHLFIGSLGPATSRYGAAHCSFPSFVFVRGFIGPRQVDPTKQQCTLVQDPLHY